MSCLSLETQVMYADDALKLIRELKRYQDTLPPHNTDLVRSVQQEIRHLQQEAESILAQLRERDDENSIDEQSTAFLRIAHATIVRDKRCLLAYHYHRTSKVKQLVWDTRAEGAGNKPAPKDIRDNLSPDEQLFFKQYAALVYRYKSYFDDFLDLTSNNTVPPKSTLIRVRAIKDVSFVTEDGRARNLARGQQDYLKRADVEKLIEKGFLMHVE